MKKLICLALALAVFAGAFAFYACGDAAESEDPKEGSEPAADISDTAEPSEAEDSPAGSREESSEPEESPNEAESSEEPEESQPEESSQAEAESSEPEESSQPEAESSEPEQQSEPEEDTPEKPFLDLLKGRWKYEKISDASYPYGMAEKYIDYLSFDPDGSYPYDFGTVYLVKSDEYSAELVQRAESEEEEGSVYLDMLHSISSAGEWYQWYPPMGYPGFLKTGFTLEISEEDPSLCTVTAEYWWEFDDFDMDPHVDVYILGLNARTLTDTKNGNRVFTKS